MLLQGYYDDGVDDDVAVVYFILNVKITRFLALTGALFKQASKPFANWMQKHSRVGSSTPRHDAQTQFPLHFCDCVIIF